MSDLDVSIPLTADSTDVQTAANPNSNFFDDYLNEIKEEVMDFAKARLRFKTLVDQWRLEADETDERRRTRDVNVSVQNLRNDGSLDEDETIIPDRVIDTNIQREQPPYINYLKNSRRLAIFNCISNPSINSQKLELEFTRGMTYIGWETPHFKCLDGAQTHGWDAIEVVYDESKPFHVGLEQIGHEKLLFPRSALNIQDCPRVLIQYDVTVVTLKSFVQSFGFQKDTVGTIIAAIKDGQKEPETIPVFKAYTKYDGKVWVSWFTLQYGVADWLKKPAPLFLGMRHQEKVMVDSIDPMTGIPTKQPQMQMVETPITQYPIYILPYRETEKPKIMDHKGRVFYDENKQEAQTAVLSAFVNGLTRASNVYVAYGQDDGSGSSLQAVEDMQMVGGRIYNKPLQFFSPPYPDPMILRAMQYFDVANDIEMGQPNFAAQNRQDSRKTAKEISAAQEQQQLLNSVQLTLFSTHIRSIYNLVWLVVQSQALQDKIKFLLVQQQVPVINPVTQTPVIDPMTGQPQMEMQWVNDKQTISEIYDIRAAGDVDVIQKQEKVQQMKQDYPVIAQTPLGNVFLAELMRLEYPDTGEKWAMVLEQSGGMIQQMQQMINNLSHIIMGIAKDHPEAVANDAQQLGSILQQAQQMSGEQAQNPMETMNN